MLCRQRRLNMTLLQKTCGTHLVSQIPEAIASIHGAGFWILVGGRRERENLLSTIVSRGIERWCLKSAFRWCRGRNAPCATLAEGLSTRKSDCAGLSRPHPNLRK